MLSVYRPPDGVADELYEADGRLRPVWGPMIEHLAARDPGDLSAGFAAGDQYLHDAGVYFRQHTSAGSTERSWPLSHVPVLISAREWAALAEGIVQRADLLERVMADLYGAGSLVSRGILPPELIAQNPEWLRPLVGTRPRSGHFLHLLAFEVGRSPDGSWFVLGDRTQAPSGAGFALENRVATARVFAQHYPRMNVARLAGFFRPFRDALNDLGRDGGGRVAILSPGPETDTYFEHAYIARYLGLPLLESDDLRVQDGRLVVRTVTGPEPVSVIWRRLDARFADPLELDEGSTLGTPGMVSAVRNQALTMVNCLGSGVLEARAMLAFLPRICEELTGAPLKLPNIATWWCGQQAERDYVRENIGRMLIGPALSTSLPFDVDATMALGGEIRASAAMPLDRLIAEKGRNLVGQEAVTLSTTPAMIDGKLQPRPMMVRVFAARTRAGWTVMPGGYARIGKTEDPTALSMRNGGSVADVWVVRDEPVMAETLQSQPPGPFLRAAPGVLPARAADNFFWLGRYVERAEHLTRKLRAYHLRRAELGGDDSALLAQMAGDLADAGTEVADPVPETLEALIARARTCASKVRDRFSTDGWLALVDLSRTLDTLSDTAVPGDDAARALGVVLRKLAGFSGLVHENMFRFTGWRFLTLGRALERADNVAALVATYANPDGPIGGFDVAIEVGDSVMAHRQRYAVETNRNTVIDLLVLDADNPRSVLFQANLICEQAGLLPPPAPPSGSAEIAGHAYALRDALLGAVPDSLDPDRLQGLRGEVGQIYAALTTGYLS